jgi:hypothetical protein
MGRKSEEFGRWLILEGKSAMMAKILERSEGG